MPVETYRVSLLHGGARPHPDSTLGLAFCGAGVDCHCRVIFGRRVGFACLIQLSQPSRDSGWNKGHPLLLGDIEHVKLQMYCSNYLHQGVGRVAGSAGGDWIIFMRKCNEKANFIAEMTFNFVY